MISKRLLASWSLSLGALGACALRPPANPPAPGFDLAGSDARAMRIADEVMEALGGRAAWDATRVIAWTFFGRRSHVWDKATGEYRLVDGERLVRMNLRTMRGRAFVGGVEVTDPAQLAGTLDEARSIWINDSYWLLMPYKLQDSGVKLRHAGEAALADGRAADVLELTFRDVGDTPENKYEVLVSRDRRLVEEWRFFTQASDAEPRFSTPWADWRPYGRILLSGERGGERRLTDIAVLDAPPPDFDRLPPEGH